MRISCFFFFYLECGRIDSFWLVFFWLEKFLVFFNVRGTQNNPFDFSAQSNSAFLFPFFKRAFLNDVMLISLKIDSPFLLSGQINSLHIPLLSWKYLHPSSRGGWVVKLTEIQNIDSQAISNEWLHLNANQVSTSRQTTFWFTFFVKISSLVQDKKSEM